MKADGRQVWRAGKSEHDHALVQALEARNLPSVLAPRYVACLLGHSCGLQNTDLFVSLRGQQTRASMC